MRQKLKPYFEPKRNRWRVECAAKYSSTGRRERYYFTSREEAEIAARKERNRIYLYGTVRREQDVWLTRTDQLDASRAKAMLLEYQKESGVKVLPGLDTLAREWIEERARRRELPITLEDVFDEYERRSKRISAKHLRNLRYTRKRFERLLSTLVCDITAEQVKRELNGLPPHAFNAHRSVIHAVLGYAAKHKCCTENVVSMIDKQGIEKRQKVLVSNELVRACTRPALRS